MAYSTENQVLYLAGVTATDVVGSSTAITQFISWADAQIEAKTGKTWATVSSKTDYFDLQENVYQQDWLKEDGLASYSKPYIKSKHLVKLSYSPVTLISEVAILEESILWNKVYDAAGTDVTDDINDVRGTPVEFDGDTLTNTIRFVSPSLVYGVGILLHTLGVTGQLTWYYYTSAGVATAFSGVTASVTGANYMTASGEVTWTMPSNWEEYDDGIDNGYQFCAKVTSNIFTINPKINNVYAIDPVNEFISGNVFSWRSSGELLLREDWLTGGYKNLKVIYYAGASTTPTIVSELSANLAAQMVLMNMMGASFDNVTSATLPELGYTTGEPYASQRATLEKLRDRAIELWLLVGEKPTLVML